MFVTDIGEEIVIEVEDSGQGIHDEVIASIFYKGFSTKEGEARIWISKGERVSRRFKWKYRNRKRDLGGALFIIALPKERGEL